MSDSKNARSLGPPSDRERRERKIISLNFGAADPVGGETRHYEVPLEVSESLELLKAACGPNLVSVIFFGSHLLGTSPSEESAADLFVVVEDYEEFYQDIGARLPARRRASIMAALNRWLPPNIIYLRDPADLKAGAKCFVISRKDFAKALSPKAPDHFCRGRMTQRVQVIYARTEEDGEQLEGRLEAARRQSLEWVPLYIRAPFTVKAYCIRMLEVSFAGEIRPESRGRLREVFEAQQAYLMLAYGRVLEEGVADGRLVRDEKGYGLSGGVMAPKRLRWRLFFLKSKCRATLRWVKYMLTFDDWLDYIARKAERRTGVRTELTKWDRRMPVIFLWPKVFRVLKAMRGGPPGTAGPDKDRRGGEDER